MKRRSRRIDQVVPLEDETEEYGHRFIKVLHDSRPTPEEELIGQELHAILAHASCKLPDRSRCALLHSLSGCPVRKIAEIMAISAGGVKSALHRADDAARSKSDQGERLMYVIAEYAACILIIALIGTGFFAAGVVLLLIDEVAGRLTNAFLRVAHRVSGFNRVLLAATRLKMAGTMFKERSFRNPSHDRAAVSHYF
ncbi:MAG: RNA polymerase sigma factor [Terriglobia bacterium]